MDRGDYSARISYSGPELPKPRPWFLHPAFIIAVLLVLGLTAWGLRRQLQLFAMRSRGVNARMEDGRLSVELPPKGLRLGEDWQWREFDNTEHRYGLEDGKEIWKRWQESNAETKEWAGKYGVDDPPDSEPYFPDFTEDQYDFVAWQGGSQMDIDGSGDKVLVMGEEGRRVIFDPRKGWREIGAGSLNRHVRDRDIESGQFWLDYNGDGTPDLFRTYVREHFESEDELPDNDTLTVIDGASGERIRSWEYPIFGDVLKGDFDGDGKADFAYTRTKSYGKPIEMRVLAAAGNELGVVLMGDQSGICFSADADGDGDDDIICSSFLGGLSSAGIGQPSRSIADTPSLAVSQLVHPATGGVAAIVVSSPLTEMMHDSGFLDMDFGSGSDFDSSAMEARMKDMEKVTKQLEELEKLLRPESKHPFESPAYRQDTYAHYQSLSAADRARVANSFSLLDLASGAETPLALPQEYLDTNVPANYEYFAQPLRLPGHKSELICLLPQASGALLVIGTDGSVVHYEELGRIPLGSEIIRGATQDWIMLAFEDRVLVYP